MKKLIVIFFYIFPLMSFSQIKQIEPPFWWSNMENPELQILCYGKNIAQYTVQISNDIPLINLRKTENPNYLFITLDVTDIPPQKFKINFLKDNKVAFSKEYQLKQRQVNSKLRKDFNSEDVIYLIMPDRFANGDPNNDSVKKMAEKANRKINGGRHGGDIKGIIDHLDYIKELGATTLWSTPLLEDNEPTYSYHHYAQSDFYKIDPRYGTNEDYKKLASELHQRKMKLIMDYVTNHWGSKHWMIQDLPTKDWIHYWKDTKTGFKRSNYRMTTQYDPYASKEDYKNCVAGWFDTTMPDINQSNPLVLKYITQNAIWWIEYANLDGLRVDTYSYNDKEAIAKWTKAIMTEYPNFNIVGEVWMHDQAQIAYWQKDSKIGAIEGYNTYLPSVMDFTLHDAVTTVFNEDKATWFNGMIKVYENFVNDFLYPNPANIMVFAGNHDTNRINEIYQSDIKKYKLAMTLIATVRGIPQLYYGDEIGMTGNKEKNGDGDIRKDFPGGWKKDVKNAFSSSGRTGKQQAYFNFTKKLFTWRKTNKAIHTGKTKHFIPKNNVYVYFRYSEKDTVMVIINNNTEKQIINPIRFKEILKQNSQGKEILTDKNIFFNKPFNVAGKTSMIIEIKK